MRPTRPALPCLAAAALLAAWPAGPAVGQDFDLGEALGRLRDLRDRLEDRDRDRDRPAEPDRRDFGRGVAPADPRQAPPGLYGGYGDRGYGYGGNDYSGNGYGPRPNGGFGPARPDYGGTDFGRRSYGDDAWTPYGPFPPPADDTVRGGEWAMRSATVRPGRYRVSEVPGGPVTVRVVAADGRRRDSDRDRRGDSRGGFGAPTRAGTEAAVFAQAREANRQAAEIGRVAAAVAGPLRDVRYGLRFAADPNQGGNLGGRRDDFAAELARRAEDAERLRADLVVAARADRRTASGESRSGDSFDALGEAAKRFDGVLHRLAEPIAGRVRDPWLRGKADELDRLDGELHAAYAAMEAARQAIRDLQDAPAGRDPGRDRDPGRGDDGGTGRLKLFALAARLTENTGALRRAVAAADGPAGWGEGYGQNQYGSAYRGGFSQGPRPGAGSALTRLTDRLDADAVALRRALGEGATAAEVAADDEAFERTWEQWQAAARGRFPDDHPVRAAGRAVDAVDRRLVTGVTESVRPGRPGRLRASAVAMSRAASAFARELPQFKLSDDRELVRAIDRLAAAADYYATVARKSEPGAGDEPRARQALERAFEEADQPLRTLADRPRDNEAGDLAREILTARDDWRDRLR